MLRSWKQQPDIEDSHQDSEQPSEQPLVLPEMTGSELIDTLKRVETVESELIDPEKFAHQVALVQPDLALLVSTQDFSPEEIGQSLSAAGVSFAGGESDEESIRDFDSGPSKIRWFRRKPYFFCRDDNVNDVRYRRRMKLHIGVKRLDWSPEAESDDDGYVKQEPFVLGATIAVDETGEATDLSHR